MEKLVGAQTLSQLPPAKAAEITGKRFFPNLISRPFIHGLRIAFSVSLVMSLIAAAASWLRGGRPLPATGEVGPFGEPEGQDADDRQTPLPEEWVPA
jgi:hypothetical protein